MIIHEKVKLFIMNLYLKKIKKIYLKIFKNYQVINYGVYGIFYNLIQQNQVKNQKFKLD